MGITARSERGLQSEINVTPMVDIMLVLLILFLVVTPFLQPGIAVVLPNSKNPDVDPRISSVSSVVVSIPSDGEYYLGKKRVHIEQLADDVDHMLDRIKNPQDRIVYIKGGVGVGYGDIVNVINEIRKLGVDQIGLVTDKKESTRPNISADSRG
jgi:biopolymer transport protein TolR